MRLSAVAVLALVVAGITAAAASDLKNISQCESDNSASQQLTLTYFGCSLLPPSMASVCATNNANGTTLKQSQECAIQCASTATGDAGTTAQFFVCGYDCICVGNDEKRFLPPSKIPLPSGEDAKFARCNDQVSGHLLSLSLQCPLNATLCGKHDGCHIANGCCVTKPAAPKRIPKLYTAMIQWCIIAIIILAILEAFLYGCFRYRRAENRAAANNADDDANAGRATDALLPLRTKDVAHQLALNLCETFPLVAPSATVLNDDTSCSICLDNLSLERTVALPCRHMLHSRCLQGFLEHQLQTNDQASCPMCRAALLSDTALPRDL